MHRGIIVFLLTTFLFACQKDRLLTSPDARIYLPVDSLFFDTIFTSTGSTTKLLRLHNPNNQRIRISEIALMGGSRSAFKINVNGQTGPVVHDIDIAAKDSAHIFVNLTINPDNQVLPFLIEDSIHIIWNGQETWVRFSAYGQNAHFIRNGRIRSNTSWYPNLPYVLLGPLVVETDATLTIQKGCRIYAHADAAIRVEGKLDVLGDSAAKDQVVFTGDRLDYPYNEYPASWPGIYFTKSNQKSMIRYANINNAYKGVSLQENTTNFSLTMEQCTIQNAFIAGIEAINARFSGTNLLIANCGTSVLVEGGGNYLFQHCTIATVPGRYIAHQDPLIQLTDAFATEGFNSLQAMFQNCIIWAPPGFVENEVLAAKRGTSTFEVSFKYGIWRMNTLPENLTSEHMITNADPQFRGLNGGGTHYSFQLTEESPAAGAAKPVGVTIDLNGRPRSTTTPDLGALEQQ